MVNRRTKHIQYDVIFRNTHTPPDRHWLPHHPISCADWKQSIDLPHPSFSRLPLSTCCSLKLSWTMFRRKQTFSFSFKCSSRSSVLCVFCSRYKLKGGTIRLNSHQRLSDAALICCYRPAAVWHMMWKQGEKEGFSCTFSFHRSFHWPFFIFFLFTVIKEKDIEINVSCLCFPLASLLRRFCFSGFKLQKVCTLASGQGCFVT